MDFILVSHLRVTDTIIKIHPLYYR